MEFSEEARKARNAYQRAWRKKNPESVREIANRYWEKKARQEMIMQAERETGDKKE